MDRPTRFENHRWVGDKRNQIVHDIDSCTSEETIDELLAARTYLCFGPDTVTEARNRGYKPCSACAGVRESSTVGVED